MDSSCNCSSKIDKILEKLDCFEQTVKSVQDGIKTLLQDTKTSNSEELPRKKRRQFQNRFPESSMKEYVHKDVLLENYRELVDRLDFSKGNMLDELFQEKAISESDHENILKLNQKRKDQNRYLIHRFRHYGTDKFETFLYSLESEYPDLSNDLKYSYDEKLKKTDKRKCICCMIIQTVDISDILDSLFEKRLIDDAIIEDRLNGVPPAVLWKQLFHQIKDLPAENNCKEVFIDILAIKYKDIAMAISSVHFQNIFNCYCQPQKIPMMSGFETDGSGSLSDISSIGTCTSVDNATKMELARHKDYLYNVSASSSPSHESEEIIQSERNGSANSNQGPGITSMVRLNAVGSAHHQSKLETLDENETAAKQNEVSFREPNETPPVDSRTTTPFTSWTFPRKSTLRQYSSFRVPSTFDRRRSGISVQQAEQFIRWTSQDPNRRDRRSPRYVTV